MKSYFFRLKRFGRFAKVFKLITVLFTVTVVFDIINIPTKTINKNGLFSLVVICFGIAMIIIAFLSENHIQGLVTAKTVNEFDAFIVISAIFDIIYLGIIAAPSLFHWYKFIALIILFFILAGLLAYRIIINKDRLAETAHKNSNVYDLKEFIDCDIALENEYPILLAEKDVDYDLFDRSFIINKLYSSIRACCGSDYSYVIGLEGPWGSGKTTIIKNVIGKIRKEKINELIVISDFDPWIYSNEEALLIALFDTILHNTGIKYSNATLRNITNSLIKSILGEHIAGKVAGSIILQNNEENIVNNIKEQIRDYLKHNDLTLVVFVDNMDRASASNIIFLLKIISKIFDLDRIVYVLAYDRERINTLLNKNLDINKHYIEKIVQQEIRIPKLNRDSFRIIVGDSLKKFFEINGINSVDQEEYRYIVEFLVDYCEDIRSFKRVINSVGTMLNIDNGLYKPDLLALEIVRFFSNDLYEEIHDNPAYYVSNDYDKDKNLYKTIFNRERFNKEGKEYYSKLKERFEIYLLEFLSNVFPYVKRGLNGDELRPEYDFASVEINKQIALKCRAASAKYFDLYFYYGKNEYTVISHIYSTFTGSINDELSNNTTENIPTLLGALFDEIPIYYQDEIINKLWLEREDFNKELNLPIFIGLISNSEKIDKESGFFMLSPYQRACSIMASLFSLINKEDKVNLLDYLQDKYQYLNTLDEVLYWLDSSSKNSQNKEDDMRELEELLTKMHEEITQNSINIYSDNYYAFHNSWALMRIKRRILGLGKNDEIDIIDYISRVVSSKTIYRIARDLIGISSGSDGYNYYITEENIKCFFATEDELFEYLENNPPKDETEEFIYRVCEEYKTGTENDWGRKSIQSDYPIRFW